MTPKKKAESLIEKFGFNCRECDNAKYCALICVDEIINSSPSLPILSDNGTFGNDIEESKVYWLSVKKELEKL